MSQSADEIAREKGLRLAVKLWSNREQPRNNSHYTHFPDTEKVIQYAHAFSEFLLKGKDPK